MKVPILTYHSNNIAGNDYATNDHVALAEDLRTIARLGLRIVSAAEVVDALLGATPASSVDNAVALTFDDGSYFDWYDMEHPHYGTQRGFAGILRDFAAATGMRAHATSFVIVSPAARAVLDVTCMAGRDWWRDEWWPQAAAEGLVAIENHSWDHNHATLPQTVQREQRKGTFKSIDSHADADAEIRAAADWLDTHLSPYRSTLFAYPYGEWNDYLVREYLPQYAHEHRLRAAFTGEPQPVEANSNRWLLPRYVCGHHWKEPPELERLLRETRS
ncbi:MAG: polysaccharide deacetylase family protein [Rudaea sp.]|uniref:polysaccharide deacetylase family protein n=1 Tax=unclassified Rudaea TaxID=2627037 RepID=UPI0010F8F4DE|nr:MULTISPECIES: polysaccharide deacetylase family protein [unclassified Rudaea]MBN8887509.1 polysaccharide deacetylase family protein [Rudaea sp.]MBR0345394.1 polysaccharide deacetylase family protein [Rudaea sp.]